MAEKTKNKKINGRMKKRIRKTSAAVLLASSIIVAAIPVPGTEAAGEAGHSNSIMNASSGVISVAASGAKIPLLNENTPIYCDSNGVFQYAYEQVSGEGNIAVLVGYTAYSSENLKIDEDLEAYIPYTTSQGTGRGYAAANQDGKPLYYREITKWTRRRVLYAQRDDDGKIVPGADGRPIYVQNNNWSTVSQETYVETRTNRITLPPAPTKTESADLSTVTQEVVFYTYQYWPCDGANIGKWNTNVNGDAVYYLYRTDLAKQYDVDKNITDTVGKNSDYWRYCQLPTKASMDAIGLTDLKASVGLRDEEYADADNKTSDPTNPGKTNRNSFFEESSNRWLEHVKVGCISNQRVKVENGVFKIDTSVNILDLNYLNKSIFGTRAANIMSVTLPPTLYAIADYSFYGCSSLEKVSFGKDSHLATLGKYAFAECTLLNTFEVPTNWAVTVIGENAFENCSSLSKFTFPVAVNKIGNEAFKGCTGLKSLDFYLSGETKLTDIGDNVFTNCSSLTDVELPVKLTKTGLGLFEGCKSLRTLKLPDNNSFNNLFFTDFKGCTNKLEWIEVPAQNPTTFTDDDNVNTFKADVGDKFYFKGYASSNIHKMTQKNEIAFMYLDEDEKLHEVYEIVKKPLTFQANKAGELLSIRDNSDSKTEFDAIVPSSVGPYEIHSIGDEFKGNAYIKSLYVPRTIYSIAAGAFEGCYNLKEVTFEEPNAIKPNGIGKDAFKTQVGAPTSAGKPELTFFGEISADSVPFQYAMEEGNNIDNGKQTETYIVFCSGNPAWLEVQYNPAPDRKSAELISVPEVDDADYRKHIEEVQKELPDATYRTMKYEDLVKAYENTPEQMPHELFQVMDAAYNIDLPSGIQSIKEGLFSEAGIGENKEKVAEKVENKITGNEYLTDNAGKSLDIVTPKIKHNENIKSITMHDVEWVDDYAFYGCENLETVQMYPSRNASQRKDGNDGTPGEEDIGAYAFAQCANLENVILPDTTGSMGLRPFAANKKLTAVKFAPESADGTSSTGSEQGKNFSCSSGIIYELENGAKDAVVECLVTRAGGGEFSVGNTKVSASELAGVTKIYDEAFMKCKDIGTVDMDSTNIKEVPEYCFYGCENLGDVIIPSGCTKLEVYSFADTKLQTITIPSSVIMFSGDYAFYDGDQPNGHIRNGVEVTTAEGSPADEFAQGYAKYHWRVSDEYLKPVYTVTFWDSDEKTVIAKVKVVSGEDAIAPTEEEVRAILEEKGISHEGKYFGGWDRELTDVGRDMDVVAKWEDTKPQTWEVRFVNVDFTEVIPPRTVRDGEAAEEPKSPKHPTEDYMFIGWTASVKDADGNDMPMNKITGNVTYMAKFDPNHKSNGDPITPGSSPSPGGSPTPGGSPAPGGSPNPNGSPNPSGSPNPNATPTPTNNGTLYTLTVVNGSGGGSYAEGTTVNIAANTPNSGYEFYNWTSSDSGVSFTSTTLAATSFKMPAKNITVTANYKTTDSDKKTTVTSSSSSNTGSTTGNRTMSSRNGGTAIQVNRGGISDTGVASATINGSTDDFVVKVTEDGTATFAVAEALKNEYGSLDNIRYFAMDISLYDESGTTEITDTEGLSVTITLPVPDELRQYGGNNKVAGVVDGNKLDKLNPKFTTIGGVPCVTFTATHFSPYTVYVDVTNLSDGAYDVTPQTGDAIHPKWFLAVGLALLSVVLFIKKDKKSSLELA